MAIPAVIYGLTIGAIRLIPIAIRIGGKIVGISYRIAAKPSNFNHAQKIFGKRYVIQDGATEKIFSQIIRHNTKVKTFSPIKSEVIKNQIKGSAEVAKNIGSQADDAALNLSRFFSTARVQPSSGVKIAGPVKEIFGKNIKFSDKTLEAIKMAERGPLSLSKDVATFVPKTTKWVKSPAQSTSAQAVKEATKKRIKEFKETSPEKFKAPIKQIVKTEKRPWYVNIMPKYLRTTKDVRITGPEKIPYTGAPYSIRTVTEGVAKKRLAGTVGGVGAAMYGYDKATGPDKLPVQAEKGIEIDISELFGGEPEIYKQQELTSGIDFYDTDEAGNVIQAQ
tara:strand:- start:293 stop:1297 length:1005 start_codon:yes stop_codon:yes gene_type:complete